MHGNEPATQAVHRGDVDVPGDLDHRDDLGAGEALAAPQRQAQPGDGRLPRPQSRARSPRGSSPTTGAARRPRSGCRHAWWRASDFVPRHRPGL
jgi:hypothetical protein